MYWTKSKEEKRFSLGVKLVGTILIFLSPFLIFSMLEMFFYLGFKTTGSFIFENKTETDNRSGLGFYESKLSNPDFISELKSTRKKIAIFGGSSAIGYASLVSFEDYLASANDDYVFHNYSVPGYPFVGFQDELLERVYKYYDAIVIYTGHNEMWSHLYSTSAESEEQIITPIGLEIDSSKVISSLNRKKTMLKASLDLVNGDNYNFKNKLLMVTNFLVYKSRLVNLCNRVIKKIRTLYNSSKSLGNPENRLPLYFQEPFISREDKTSFLINFQSSMENIVKKLGKNQELILSTVLSNDLFPPNLDYIGEIDIDKNEVKLRAVYDSLTSEKSFPDFKQISKLSDGAHKDYLQAVNCIENSSDNLNSELKQECMKIALQARAKDVLPYRVIPSINIYIRELERKSGNLLIVDPEAYLYSGLTKKEYLDLFVDFQHPSALGHLLIAKEMLKVLSPDKEIEMELLNSCGTYKISNNGLNKIFEINHQKVMNQILTNVRWLKSFIERSSVKFMYEYYLDRALQNISECKA